jgi:hypothetical protein
LEEKEMNKTQIAKALREAVFAPGKQGPLKIVADVGNLDYYIRRASENLILSLTALTTDQRVYYLNTALSLTALAKVTAQESLDESIDDDEEFVKEFVKDLKEAKRVEAECFIDNKSILKIADITNTRSPDEMDKSKQAGEVRGPGDGVQGGNLSGNFFNGKGSYTDS